MFTLRGITSGYGDTVVLRDVDFTVGEGEVVALLGPNGAGKTTLLRTATGFVKPSRGSIEFDGVDLTKAPGHRFASRGVCMLPEGRGIFPSLTVLENIRVQAGRRPERPMSDVVDEVRELFPVLTDRLRQTAGDLSGGEQQMLALCRAYITRPRVVLVDEASLGLAPLVVDTIYKALSRLARAWRVPRDRRAVRPARPRARPRRSTSSARARSSTSVARRRSTPTRSTSATWESNEPHPERHVVGSSRYLDGRVAVVTGAGRGIFRAVALQMASAGASVVVVDSGSTIDGSGTDRTVADETVAEIRARGGDAIACAESVRDLRRRKCDRCSGTRRIR